MHWDIVEFYEFLRGRGASLEGQEHACGDTAMVRTDPISPQSICLGLTSEILIIVVLGS